MASDEEESVKESPQDSARQEESANGSRGQVIGSAAIRPIFLGNLIPTYTAEDVTNFTEHPLKGSEFKVDRIDIKRGYCFVFLKDAKPQSDKERVEEFVKTINGMDVPNVSRPVRSEFARGDGRAKKKEDERRKKISPSEHYPHPKY